MSRSPDDEIVKAFEIKKDKLVVLTDEDFEAVKTEGVKTIEISDFVPYEEIDPIYFDRTFYLGPQNGAEKVYALFREAMEQDGPRRHRQVRDAGAPAPRLPARARGRDHAREDALPRRDPPDRRHRAAPRQGREGRARAWRRP